MYIFNDISKIPWEEIIFVAKDLSENPEALRMTENIFKRLNVDIFEGGVNMLPKLTEGFIVKIWLDQGGVIPEKYKKIYERKS